MHTQGDAIRTGIGSDLGRKMVGIQGPVSDKGKVLDLRVQHAFTEAILDQLATSGADVQRYCRKLKGKQYAAVPTVDDIKSDWQ